MTKIEPATSMMPPTDDGKRVSHLDLVVRSGGIALEDSWMVIHWGEGVWIHYRMALASFMGPLGLAGLGLGP
jgi:hypothetical protein